MAKMYHPCCFCTETFTSPGGHTRHQNNCTYQENIIFEPTGDYFESQIPCLAEDVFGPSFDIEIPSYNEDLSSWTCLDGQSWNSNSVDQTEDFNQNVDSSDDYDNVLSVADLPKRRRSIQISDKVVKKHKNDMSDCFQAVGKTVGLEVEDLISGNISGAAIGMYVQSLSACGSI